jgi:ABC-type multidrug transport system ATPase subunit
MENNIRIELQNAAKRFVGEWIFKNASIGIDPKEKIVILGANGSGKSTLMQVIVNYQTLTRGKIGYFTGAKEISNDKIFQHLSIAAPYLELIEEYNLAEAIAHQKIFKPFFKDLDTKKIIDLSGLEKSKAKPIRLYSSGMKQRLKLTLSVLADCPLLFLDEPCSNLDANAVAWYKNLVQTFAKEKTIVVCSNNIKDEFEFCEREILMEELN